LMHRGKVIRINQFDTKEFKEGVNQLVIDRGSVQIDEDSLSRLADSIQTAFYEGKGSLSVQVLGSEDSIRSFSSSFELDGMTFLEPNTHFFSFNNPYGACPTCEGYGNVIGIDEALVIPNTNLSIYDNAISRSGIIWNSNS